STISNARMQDFLRRFEKFKIEERTGKKETPVIKKFFWVVRDKEKFEALIGQLSVLVGKLNDVIPPGEGLLDTMIRSDLTGSTTMRQLQLVSQATKNTETPISDLAEEDLMRRCQKRVLDRLWYRVIDDRRNDVAEAHPQTLQWALQPSNTGIQWDSLPEWLGEGSDIYWLYGKPGSGKSTLMKFLFEHPEVHQLLQQWANEERLITPNFFFWYLGRPERNTHEGLLRGLLYSILAEDPTLIPNLLPGILAETRNAFAGLADIALKTKICFFIDGLDEYFGNPIDGVQFIQDLASNRNIKVLVSSRPIPDLTVDDITAYVNDAIGTHSHIQNLRSMDPVGTEEILSDVVKKASGVFLWVVLACRSLLEGFAAFDYVEELRDRVNELPPELEQLFEHILKRIEPRDHEQTAKLLRICYQSRVDLATEIERRSLGIAVDPEMYTIGLALAGEYELGPKRSYEFPALTLAQRRMKCEVLEARLRSRCCGLLEVRLHAGSCFCGHIGSTELPINSRADSTVDSKVDFMHRSVFYFLKRPGIWNLGVLQITDGDFDPLVILAQMRLHLLQLSAANIDVQCRIGYQDPYKTMFQIIDLSRGTLFRTMQADQAICKATADILLEFSRFTLQFGMNIREHFYAHPLFRTAYNDYETAYARNEPSESSVMHLSLVLAIELGMNNVVKFWASKGPLIKMEGKFPLLYHAFEKPYVSAFKSFPLDVTPCMVRMLLDEGADPNARFAVRGSTSTTPWINWLKNQGGYSTPLEAAVEITRLFMKAGADLDTSQNELSQTIDGLLRRGFLDAVTAIRQGHAQLYQTGSQKTEKRPFGDGNDPEDYKPPNISRYPYKRVKLGDEVEPSGTEEADRHGRW
ncbi:prion-inhibition and propagation-domain-containing protein, partial [Apiospora aurea]